MATGLKWLAAVAVVVGVATGGEARAAEYRYNGLTAAKYAVANYNLAYGPRGNPFANFYNWVPPDGREGGGNCTNFASQCIMAGLVGSDKVATVYQSRTWFVADRGLATSWYYLDSDDRAKPAWAGAHGLFEFARTNAPSYKGLHFIGVPLDPRLMALGDIMFADWTGNNSIDHTMVVTGINPNASGYNKVILTYQNANPNPNKTNRPFGDVFEAERSRNGVYGIYYVYRPVNYTTTFR